MRRREFITIIGTAAASWPLAVRAQQKPVPVIGYLNVGFPQLQHPFVVAFHEGLKEAGFVAGENVAIEYRWAEERYERLPELAADLIRRKVDVIVATGELPLRAAASATSTIPVVFTIGSDPVQSGLVASLARPDGNITGFTAIATQLVSKRFELVSELLPQAKKIAVLTNPSAVGGFRCHDHASAASGKPKRDTAVNLEGRRRKFSGGRVRSLLPRSTPTRLSLPPTPFLSSTRTDRCVGCALRRSSDLRTPGIRRCRRSDQLWAQCRCASTPGRHLHRQNPQGGQAGGSADPATDKVRSGVKS